MLDLSNNSLSSIPPRLFASLGRPARDMQDGFDLSHNPWVCNEDLRDLYRWLQDNKHKMFSKNDTRCAGPEALKGRRLLDVVDLESLQDGGGGRRGAGGAGGGEGGGLTVPSAGIAVP
ncbi:Leucine-rich alpha-2-glycoprotein [Cricetulus griseus]|uniref:Leucine-rich alpha-2-glycoprotein n=2 Tax=Cricetulus griseus TaxID=10029 RepID=G3HCG4_CRIGR|nr:Leucine-rich alpha-2-glycoprotein [Cricetulus griseus]